MVISSRPQWAQVVQTSSTDSGPSGSEVDMGIHGTLLILQRSWNHLAHLAQKFKVATDHQWPPELVHCWLSLSRKHAPFAHLFEAPPIQPHLSSWSRVVVAARSMSLKIYHQAAKEARDARVARRARLKEELSGSGGFIASCKILRDPPLDACPSFRRMASGQLIPPRWTKSPGRHGPRCTRVTLRATSSLMPVIL